jgi:hypothetical protein
MLGWHVVIIEWKPYPLFVPSDQNDEETRDETKNSVMNQSDL